MNGAQDDSGFAATVAAAARAAWWSLLVGAIALSLMGIWFLVCTRTACLMEWVAGVWGVEPATAHVIFIVFLGAVKFFLFVWAIHCVCLSLWARGLRRTGRA